MSESRRDPENTTSGSPVHRSNLRRFLNSPFRIAKLPISQLISTTVRMDIADCLFRELLKLDIQYRTSPRSTRGQPTPITPSSQIATRSLRRS